MDPTTFLVIYIALNFPHIYMIVVVYGCISVVTCSLNGMYVYRCVELWKHSIKRCETKVLSPAVE